MKRLFSLVMLTALLVSLLAPSALAVDDKIKIDLIKEISITDAMPNPPVMTITNESPHDIDITIEVFDELARGNVQTMQFHIMAGEAPLVVNTQVYKPLSQHGQLNTYRYRVTSANGYRKNFYIAQIMYIDKATNTISYKQWDNPIFGRNSVSSFGPQFRVLTPELTKEWYMFTPIDLSIQGRQTVELVGGNMYNVGEVYVDVYGDTVNVTYMYHYDGAPYSKIERVSEYLNFFPSYDAVHSVKPEDNPSVYAFGQPFSIANNLAGDTRVLMFVRNIETFYRFPVPDRELRRNYPKSEENMALRQHMLNLMDPVPGLVLINDHNYAATM